MVIDRKRDRYFEQIIDSETGEVLQICEEPLSDQNNYLKMAALGHFQSLFGIGGLENAISNRLDESVCRERMIKLWDIVIFELEMKKVDPSFKGFYLAMDY